MAAEFFKGVYAESNVLIQSLLELCDDGDVTLFVTRQCKANFKPGDHAEPLMALADGQDSPSLRRAISDTVDHTEESIVGVLNNGGANGLDDFYVSLAPKMPWGLKSKIVYHHFWSDEKSDSLGDELDFVLSKPLNSHLTILTKAAWLEGTSKGPADRWRYWLQLSFEY